MSKSKSQVQYYCVAVQRNYEDTWRFISKHGTEAEAQAELLSRRAYTGVFNYDNAVLRVVSRQEAKREFGPKWEYTPIGSKLVKMAE